MGKLKKRIRYGKKQEKPNFSNESLNKKEIEQTIKNLKIKLKTKINESNLNEQTKQKLINWIETKAKNLEIKETDEQEILKKQKTYERIIDLFITLEDYIRQYKKFIEEKKLLFELIKETENKLGIYDELISQMPIHILEKSRISILANFLNSLRYFFKNSKEKEAQDFCKFIEIIFVTGKENADSIITNIFNIVKNPNYNQKKHHELMISLVSYGTKKYTFHSYFKTYVGLSTFLEILNSPKYKKEKHEKIILDMFNNLKGEGKEKTYEENIRKTKKMEEKLDSFLISLNE